MADIEPAVMTLNLQSTSVAPGQTSILYCDLSQMASIVNRRFYRQGLNWGVAGFKIISRNASTGPLQAAYVQVLGLQNTWVTAQAWEKAFRHWRKQQDEALDEAGLEGVKSKFNDFKIFMDDNHYARWVTVGNDLNLCNQIPAGGYATGEWEPSQIVIPNDGGVPGATEEYELKMYGASNADTKAIVEGYALSRPYPQSPDPATPGYATSDSWLSQMQDVGEIQEQVVDNAVIRNNQLPYSQDLYPGMVGNSPVMQLHDKSLLTTTTIGGTTRLKGGNFPCGLIQLQITNTAGVGEGDVDVDIVIDLVPGTHRGYMAESMLEMA